MMKRTTLVPSFALPWAMVPASLILLAVGCSEGTAQRAPVRGTILYKGLPVAGAIIVLTPDETHGSTGPQARAESEADGTFVAKTGDELGAIPGWYRVTVMALEGVPDAAPGQRFVIPRCLLPDKYRDPELSGLSCEIKAGLDNFITLNLD